jgi:chromate reductase, NAD(P)H dehydrogenase (quinone)
MISLIVGTNRPDSNTRKVAAQIEEFYAELKVPLRVLDLAQLPPEIFSPQSYAEKPEAFQPFTDAVLQATGLHVVTPEYNGSIPGVSSIGRSVSPGWRRESGAPCGRWNSSRPSSAIATPTSTRNAFSCRKSETSSTIRAGSRTPNCPDV